METESKIQEGTDIVKNATSMAYETEAIGNDIVNDLAQQRETIQRAKANTAIISGELQNANKTLKNMEKPWYQFW